MAHVLACKGHEVSIWDFFPEVVTDIRLHRKNSRFLPRVCLHDGVCATSDAGECVTDAALVVIGVPSLFISSTLAPVVPALMNSAVLLNLAKGFAPQTRQLPSFLMGRLAPGHSCVHLAGPAIANELARGLPAAVVLAAKDDRIAERVASWLAGPTLLVSTTTDVTGAAIGGILKNVYAILLGCLETLTGGARNLEAAALNASIHEMATIARAHGGQESTLYGLAGLGDLVATGFSRDSHNRRFGQSLASGKMAAEIAEEMRVLPEGVRTATAACGLARAGKVRAPLARLVSRWIDGVPPSIDGLIRVLRTAQRTQ